MNICLCFYLEKEYNQSIPLKLLPTFMNINNPQFIMLMQKLRFDSMGIILDSNSDSIDICIQNIMAQKTQLKYTWAIVINITKEKVEADYTFIEFLVKFIQNIKLEENSLIDFYSTANETFYAISSRFYFMSSKIEKDIIIG